MTYSTISMGKLYHCLRRSIKVLEAHTEIKGISNVIKTCRLKPYKFVFQQRSWKTFYYDWWFDEFGNSLKINKKKKIEIIYGDLSLNMNDIVCTDLYYGLSIDKVYKISKLAYINYGLDEETFEECILLSLLGIDDFFRTYLYVNGSWEQVSTLMIGYKNIDLILKNSNINNYKELANNKNIKLPCSINQAWLTSLPIQDNFVDVLDKQCKVILPILGVNKNI